MKKVIKMPVLKAKVILVVGDYKDVGDYLNSVLYDAFDGNYLGRCCYKLESDSKLPFLVVIHSKSAAISVIAHEAVHAASFILDGMGMNADFNNDEIQAYIVQHICQEAESLLDTYGVNNAKSSKGS